MENKALKGKLGRWVQPVTWGHKGGRVKTATLAPLAQWGLKASRENPENKDLGARQGLGEREIQVRRVSKGPRAKPENKDHKARSAHRGNVANRGHKVNQAGRTPTG